MENAKTILFLSEMPLTNGVIQAQLVPMAVYLEKNGYKTHIIETIGRFDSQEEHRPEIAKKLEENKVASDQILIPRFTLLPSILYFTWKSLKLLRRIIKNKKNARIIIYARNYKFAPVLILAKTLLKISVIYSPRGAYVAERKYYKTFKDALYGSFIAKLEKAAIQKSSATIVESERFKKHLEDIYSIKERNNIGVISNYYDEALIKDSAKSRENIRQKMGFENKKVVVYAGTAEIWYQFEKMFDLVSKLKKRDDSIFFQLFIKKDYARKESFGLAEKLDELGQESGLIKKQDYNISSYPPQERYQYLSACDAGICLTTPQEFKTMMLYLKIVDYLGAGLPIVVNSEVKSAVEIIKNSGIGAVVDYENWDDSISRIDLGSFFGKSGKNSAEYKKFSSLDILPKYLDLFSSVFEKNEKK